MSVLSSVTKCLKVLLIGLFGFVGALMCGGSTNEARLVNVYLPTYPPLARSANIQGKVQIHVRTNSEGTVISAVADDGPPLLTQAAIENVKRWRFSGPDEQTITYEFKVEGTARSDDPYYRYGKIVFQPPNWVEVIVPPPVIDRDTPKHAKYTKYQYRAAGFWRVVETPPQGVSVKWLVIGLGDSPSTMTVRWPTGLGCQNEEAEIRGETISTVGGNLRAVIQIRGPKKATLSMGEDQIVLHLRKTKEATNFVCE